MKVVTGNFRPSRENPNEPDPDTEIPSCPPHLTSAAKAEWYRITPLLEELGLIAKVNRAALAAYCATYARWIKAERMIAKEGEVIMVEKDFRRGKMGRPSNVEKDKTEDELDEMIGTKIYCIAKKNPWLDISNKSALLLHKFAVEFGLTPASQGKVHGKPREEKEKGKERFFK